MPHNVLFDFDAFAESASWIDEIAREAKRRRDADPGESVIGHADWTSAERRAARAAAVYVRAYSTRCGHALGGDPDGLRLQEYAAALLE